MARKRGLPNGVTPRLLSREAAARYVGLSPGAFAAEVAAGTFPAPFLLKRTRRRLRDVRALDAALDTADRSGTSDDGEARKRAWAARQKRKGTD